MFVEGLGSVVVPDFVFVYEIGGKGSGKSTLARVEYLDLRD
jgi:hypothetical protein